MLRGYTRTALFLSAITAIFMVVGFLIGGNIGMIIALIFAGATNLYSYWNSDKIVLRRYKAQELDDNFSGDLYNDTKALAKIAGMPMPKLYIINSEQPNAFATGRNPANGAVACSVGLLNMLSRREVNAVVAHELAHIKNRDTLIMTITATIAGAISALANISMFFGRGNGRGNPIATIALMMLAPMAASLVQMAISRTREYAADKEGAIICNDPLALASALNKISGGGREIPNYDAEAHPESAHLFIMNPLSGSRLSGLFSTHPNTDSRIEKLQDMAEDIK